MPIIRSLYNPSKRPPNPVAFDVPDFFSEPTPFAASGTKLLALVNHPETWEQHFTVNGWSSIANQIAAGYPYYAHPSMLTGKYEEIFDYGVVIDNSIISVNFSRSDIAGDVDVLVSIANSLDNITYTPIVSGSVQFSQAFRYVFIRLDFIGTANGSLPSRGIDLTVFTKLIVSVSVKEQVDSGSFLANSAHVPPGTSQLFNKPFKDINSLTATVESTNEPYEVVLSWVDTPNPILFYVMVFDTAGNRVTKQISWKARGVV